MDKPVSISRNNADLKAFLFKLFQRVKILFLFIYFICLRIDKSLSFSPDTFIKRPTDDQKNVRNFANKLTSKFLAVFCSFVGDNLIILAAYLILERSLTVTVSEIPSPALSIISN